MPPLDQGAHVSNAPPVTALAATPQLVVLGDAAGRITLLSPLTGTVRACWQAHSIAGVAHVSVMAHCDVLVTGGAADRCVHVWDLADWSNSAGRPRHLRRVQLPPQNVLAGVFPAPHDVRELWLAYGTTVGAVHLDDPGAGAAMLFSASLSSSALANGSALSSSASAFGGSGGAVPIEEPRLVMKVPPPTADAPALDGPAVVSCVHGMSAGTRDGRVLSLTS
jgi:hypothetical protein